MDGRPQDVAFFSQVDRQEGDTVHATCTSDECVAHHIGEGYQTAHAIRECACEMIEYAPDFSPLQTPEPTNNGCVSSGLGKGMGVEWLRDSAQKLYDDFTKEIPAITFENG